MDIIQKLHFPHAKTVKVVKIVEEFPHGPRAIFVFTESFCTTIEVHQQPDIIFLI